MNKPALKRFATEARRELLERVELQARKIGVTAEGIQKAQIESSDAIFIDGKQLTEKERVQRNKLIARIRDIGFNRVMEEAAYTWFNRFTALRFMEVNDYLPTRVRVFSSINEGNTEPDMMKEALSLDLDLDKERIYDMKINNKDEELFKYLILKHCNDLNRFMPFMFETIDDYTEVLFPEGLLATDSIIRKMTNIEAIPERNWEKIEVIGWLYQYYIAEEKDRVFKAKKKYKAEEIPFATQLFTPDWIVRYMVQNSLGRYWVEAHPEHHDLVDNWEFFLQNTEEGYEEKIAPYINKELKVEDIKCFDPAMGSGHILVYIFDVLYEIYSKSGYMEREIPRLIIENNLYGLDIDDRAYQLASFSIVMKAMAYNKRFLKSIEKEGLIFNLASIQETNNLTKEDIEFLAKGNSIDFDEMKTFIKQFQNAKTIGSLIKLSKSETSQLQRRLELIETTPITDLFEVEKRDKALALLPKIVKQTQIMSLKFDVLVTNPPYMGSRSMNSEMSDYLKRNYPDSKTDLFATFMDIEHFLKKKGFYASINQHAWMFLSSLQKLRRNILDNKFIDSMLHLGPRAFEEIGGEVVQSTTFVLRNIPVRDIKGIYVRLVEEKTAKQKHERAIEAVNNTSHSNRYSFDQNSFSNIPGSPIVYWLDNDFLNIFNKGISINEISDYTGSQNKTADNNKYLRKWWEVKRSDTGVNKKWVLYAKGGNYRKHFGNLEDVVDWSSEARKYYKNNKTSNLLNSKYWYKEGITYTDISTKGAAFRYLPAGSVYDMAGPTINYVQDIFYILALFNTKITTVCLQLLNPTMHIQVSDVKNIPIIIDENKKDKIESIEKNNVNISKNDWDSFETSFDFNKPPILIHQYGSTKIRKAFENWKDFSEKQFYKLKFNEESLNKIFFEIYGLQNSMKPDIEENDISLSKANLKRDITFFISYAVGCIFGRYSLDQEGITYAGGEFDNSRYKKIHVDEDNITPILSSAYFKDDLATKFMEFIIVTFGEEGLEENLSFLANALGRKKNETARETLRRYFLNDFYKDHVQVYKKRPIYWLFTSGKEKAFNCLIYMHRYDKTTLSRIRTDYLHEVQIRMDAEKRDLLNIIEGDSTTKEISDAKKELKSLDKKIDELKAYDELLHHMADMQIEIDLDDGVAFNYAKFEGLVAKI